MKQTLNDVRLALLFPIQWWSQPRFCCVQVDEAFQPRHKRHSLPLCGPYLATSNILSINKVNTKYNGQCSKNEPFAMTGRQILQIDHAFRTATSSSEWWKELPGNRKSPSSWSVAQLAFQNEACSRETMWNTHLKQWREAEIDRGLCAERDRCRKKASWRCKGSD